MTDVPTGSLVIQTSGNRTVNFSVGKNASGPVDRFACNRESGTSDNVTFVFKKNGAILQAINKADGKKYMYTFQTGGPSNHFSITATSSGRRAYLAISKFYH